MFGFSKKSDEEEKNDPQEEQEEESQKKKKSPKQRIEEEIEFYKMPRGVKLGRPKKEKKEDKKNKEGKKEKDKDKDKETKKKAGKKESKIREVSAEDKPTEEQDSKTKVIGAVIIVSGLIVIGGVIYLGYIYFVAPTLQGPNDNEPVAEEYELAVNIEGEGSVEPSGSNTYSEGEEMTVTADPADGWEFVQFSGDCSGNSCSLVMEEDKEVTARFEEEEEEEEEYELSIDTEGEGTTDPSDGGLYSDGESVTVTADPEEGWEFTGFSGDCTGTSTCQLNMSRDREVSVSFEEEEEEESTSTPEFKDSDEDGLSDAEEEVFGSDPEDEDTDGDGYDDSTEISNFYDPLDSDEGKLADNSNISEYTNSEFSYSLLRPSDWSREEVDQSRTVMFQKDTDVFLSIIVQDNEDDLDIVSWYEDKISSSGEEPDAEVVEGDGWQGIPHSDSPVFYITDEDRENVFVINMTTPSDVADDTYNNIWQMAVDSFEIE